MPTYTYRCESCGAVTEAVHGMQEVANPVCEPCGGLLRRIITTAPAVTKPDIKIDQTQEVGEDEGGYHNHDDDYGSACVLHQKD